MSSRSTLLLGLLIVLSVLPHAAKSAGNDSLFVRHADRTEVQLAGSEYIVHFVGNVIMQTGSGVIHCDSVVYRQNQDAMLRGDVFVDDTAYSLRSDSAFYSEKDNYMHAWGERVELYSFTDSIYAVGPYAYLDRDSNSFYMNDRPTLYLKYPDSSRMIEVIPDSLEYSSSAKLTVAIGNVIINSKDLSSTSGLALLDMDTEFLELTEDPVAIHGGSSVSGRLIGVDYDGDLLSSIIVTDSAEAQFREPTDSSETYFDESTLRGERIVFDFEYGMLKTITSSGQAYSWYYPSPQGGTEYRENSVSGDTIRFIIDEQKQLKTILVVGGAIGAYVSGQAAARDSGWAGPKPDTVDYSSEFIDYNLDDSVITLRQQASIESGTVSLAAHHVAFDTQSRLIEAFSAVTAGDSALDPNSFTALAQPNDVPVVLLDGNEELVGDYLEYSLDTEKGRILRSKTNYDPGLYYGNRLFRERENIFYIDQGRFTTCDQDEPHFHFRSSNLKLIEGDKLIARPMVAYLGRLPVLVFPYYVFPLKKGRHSGIVPFQFGNFERDVRYVTDIGYFWAASDYWDWEGTVDYYDNSNTFTFKSHMNVAKRYVITNTYLDGRYTRVGSYDASSGTEGRSVDYVLKGSYNHQVSPSLKISGYGEYTSSEDYFLKYSPNLDERLRREMTSKLTIQKAFGTNTSVTAWVKHTDKLDYMARSNVLPEVSLSLPILYLFGNGTGDDRRWYHDFKLRYTPNLKHISTRDTVNTGYLYDTTVVAIDSTDNGDGTWTIITADTSITAVDTLFYRTRKQYAKVNHSPTIYLPTVQFGNYLNLTPSFRYAETWFHIFKTDQSDSAGIEAGSYRTHSWNTSLKASTTLYGTAYPNLFGLTGLRHVLSPSATYTYRPDIDEYPEVRSFAGGGAGSTKSSAISFGLNQDFMVKVGSGDDEKSLNLLALKSSFSYDFEKDSMQLSDMTTSYSSSAIPAVTINGTLRHRFYESGTNDLSFWSPYKTSFSFNASLKLKGPFPLFDPPASGMPRGADSATALSGRKPAGAREGRWNCTFDYQYSESGRGDDWQKKVLLKAKLALNFNLTPSTSVTVSQTYNILDSKTVNNSITIIRQIHCWTGSLFWVPVGSNRGFGFKLFVTELPEIKIDSGHDDFLGSIQRYR